VAFGQPDAPAVDADVVVSRVGFRAELADRLTIDGHATLEHLLLGCPT
jgi:hypothetical protein